MPKDNHHLAAPLPDELFTEAYDVIHDIRDNGADKKRRERLHGLIMKLTETGVDFFFMEPLRRMGAGPMMRKMASMGISSMVKGTKMVINNVLKKADAEHIEGILVFIEEILFEPEPES